MAKKPVIGISCSWIIDQEGAFAGYKRTYVNHDYVRSVYEAGGVPLMLPFVDGVEKLGLLAPYLDLIDGLVLSGGHDIDPAFYGEEPQQRLGATWAARDRYDHSLFKGALKKKMPVLGICRGFQIINASLGGKLLQDLSYSEHTLLKHVQGHSPEVPTHWVQLEPGNPFHELYGDKVYVNSWHHQVVAKEGKGLTVCGRSSDGVIEAVSDVSRRILGAQWHPEMMSVASDEMKKLFQYFVNWCK